MRLSSSCVALLAALAGILPAQDVVGTWSIATQQGGKVTLRIEPAGAGKVKGQLTGNGATMTLEGQLDEGDVLGTLRGNGGAAIFGATVQQGRLLVELTEVGPNGVPNMATTRQLAFTRDASARPGNDAATRQQGAVTEAPGGATATASATDQALARLLLSSAWCSFSYSGSSTYTGGSGGRTSTTRVAFRNDGTMQTASGSEMTNSGSAGQAYGSNSSGQVMRWRVENGALLVSADGTQWQRLRTEVQRNSNGYPIVKADDVEYMQCR